MTALLFSCIVCREIDQKLFMSNRAEEDLTLSV